MQSVPTKRFHGTTYFHGYRISLSRKSINKNGVNILDTNNYNQNSIDPTINVSGKGDHVPEPERMIRTIKDGVRCTKASLPMFKKFPKRFIIEMVAAVLLFYNFSILVGGASTTIPPYTIMTGCVLNVK